MPLHGECHTLIQKFHSPCIPPAREKLGCLTQPCCNLSITATSEERNDLKTRTHLLLQPFHRSQGAITSFTVRLHKKETSLCIQRAHVPVPSGTFVTSKRKPIITRTYLVHSLQAKPTSFSTKSLKISVFLSHFPYFVSFHESVHDSIDLTA